MTATQHALILRSKSTSKGSV